MLNQTNRVTDKDKLTGDNSKVTHGAPAQKYVLLFMFSEFSFKKVYHL